MDIMEYLGGHFSPWTGLQHNGITTTLQEVLYRRKSAFLKPHQKLDLLTTYLIPHFLHATIIATPSISVIRDMDSFLQAHLTACYTAAKDGGLGCQNSKS